MSGSNRRSDGMPTRTYSVAETAALFGVSRWSIYKAIENGNLTGLRFGNVTRIPKIEVDRLLGDTDDPAPTRTAS